MPSAAQFVASCLTDGDSEHHSEAQPALAATTPLHTAARQNDTGDLPAGMRFQGRPRRHVAINRVAERLDMDPDEAVLLAQECSRDSN